LLVQVIDFVTKSPHVVTTAGLIQSFADGPLNRQMAEIEREVAALGAEFDAAAELRDVLSRLRERKDKEARARALAAELARYEEQHPAVKPSPGGE
jgi:hypothetical protein